MSHHATKCLLALLVCLPLCGLSSTRAADDEKSMEAIGGLSAGYIYETYLCIGMIGDNVANKTMEAAAGKALLASVVGMIDPIDKQLGVVGDNASGAENKAGIKEMRSIIALLRTEGKELQGILDGDATHAAKFDAARKQAWEKIKALLGIKD
jgi:hypothetical protein